MPVHCGGKQGTYLRISGNGIQPVEIITGGGAESVQTFTSNSNDSAYWDIYTSGRSSTGAIVEVLRASNRIKQNWESFYVRTVTPGNYTVTKSSIPTGSVSSSWSAINVPWVSRVVFRSGSFPTTTYRTVVKSFGGQELFNRTSTSGAFLVTEIECGCPSDDCQHGTFPTNYCCSSCAQQSGILSSIKSALQSKANA
jgi:hypothetical protein